MSDPPSLDDEEDDLRPQIPPASLRGGPADGAAATLQPTNCVQGSGGSSRRVPSRALQNVLDCRAAVHDARRWEKREMLLSKTLVREQTKAKHEENFQLTLQKRVDATQDVRRQEEAMDRHTKTAVEKLRTKLRREKLERKRAVAAARVGILTARHHVREVEQFQQRERAMELADKREGIFLTNKSKWGEVQKDRQSARRQRVKTAESAVRRAQYEYQEKHSRLEESTRLHRLQAEAAMLRSSQLSAILNNARATRTERIGCLSPAVLCASTLSRSGPVELSM